MTKNDVRFIDTCGARSKDLNLWPAVIITKEEIESIVVLLVKGEHGEERALDQLSFQNNFGLRRVHFLSWYLFE